MELQKFIEDALKQITAALHAGHLEMVKSGVGNGVNDSGAMNIEFDIAITTAKESKDGVEGKVSVVAGLFSVSGKTALRDEVNNASRIKFVVPIHLKTMDAKPYAFV